VIEVLLHAERALAMGLLDQAERLYAQAVAADPRNSIAVVGLARVALEQGDGCDAYRLAMEALAIDPENVAAARLAHRLEEIHAARGLPLVAAAAMPEPGSAATAGLPSPATREPTSAGAPVVSHPRVTSHAPSPASTVPTADRSIVDRLLRRNHR
jgi:tetratricopeptide (TPR) repeat protein